MPGIINNNQLATGGWRENLHYVRFRDINVSPGGQIQILVQPSESSGYSIINGLQALEHGPDTDADGLSDGEETFLYHTNPNSPDTDGDGVSDYQQVWEPQPFSVSFDNLEVSTTTAAGTVEGGPAEYMAVLVNSEDFDSAVWVPYKAEVVVALGPSDGDYDLWVGLKGKSGATRWSGTQITLDRVPPAITLEDPNPTTTAWPVIQIKGSANEQLAEITYDLSNAEGSTSGLDGSLLDFDLDPDLHRFTTTLFQCYDVGLAPGNNLVTIHVTDLAGNTASAQIIYYLDAGLSQPTPQIQIYWPADGARVGASTLWLRGWIDNPTAVVTAQVQGSQETYVAEVLRSGLFFVKDMPLSVAPDVDVLVTVTATGPNVPTATRTITIRKSPISLAIDPVDTSGAPGIATVSGSISDSAYVVWVNGVAATMSGNTWRATDVPINYAGVGTVQVRAYPPGQVPSPGDGGHVPGSDGTGPSRGGGSGRGALPGGASRNPADANNPPRPGVVDDEGNVVTEPRVLISQYTVHSVGKVDRPMAGDKVFVVTNDFQWNLAAGGSAQRTTIWQNVPPMDPTPIVGVLDVLWGNAGSGTATETRDGVPGQPHAVPRPPGNPDYPLVQEYCKGFRWRYTLGLGGQFYDCSYTRHARTVLALYTGQGHVAKTSTFTRLNCPMQDLSRVDTISYDANLTVINQLCGPQVPLERIRINKKTPNAGQTPDAGGDVFLKNQKQSQVALNIKWGRRWVLGRLVDVGRKAVTSLTRAYHPTLSAYQTRYLQPYFDQASDFFGTDEDRRYYDSQLTEFDEYINNTDDVPAYVDFLVSNDRTPTTFPYPYNDAAYLDIRSEPVAIALRDQPWADIKVVRSIAWDGKTIGGYSDFNRVPSHFLLASGYDAKEVAHEWLHCVNWVIHRSDPRFLEGALMLPTNPGTKINREERNYHIWICYPYNTK